MKSITIHKLDEATSIRLQEKADREGSSLNQCVKSILRSALGLDAETGPDWTADFRPFFGAWSVAEAKEFETNTEAFSGIDEEMWEE